jgi:hypothetical protein
LEMCTELSMHPGLEESSNHLLALVWLNYESNQKL